MVVRINSAIYTCPVCGWSKTVTPRSDALMPGEVFDACPACGHSPLQVRPAGKAESVLGQLADQARRWMK